MASVAEIDGLRAPLAPPPPPLDQYTGAAAAYSVRLLRTAYTGAAMRVRRDTAGGTGDDDEADVAFDNGVISLDSAVSNFSGTSNATNLGQFLNATGYTDADSLTVVADGFVDEWKDQSGNANDAEQATFASQPQIFDSASPTDLIILNGKPCVKFVRTGSSTGTSLLTPSASWSTSGALEFFMVFKNDDTNGNQETWSNASNRMFAGAATTWVRTTAGDLTYTLSKIANQNLFVYEHNSTARTIYIDASQDATSASPSNVSTTSSIGALGRRYNVNEGHADVSWQELIHYPSDQSSNRTAIETNLNDYFSIY